MAACYAEQRKYLVITTKAKKPEMGSQIFTDLVSGMQAEIPQALLDRRREAMLEEIKDDLGRQGVQWGEYEAFMKEQDKLGDFMADLAKNAETRVRRDLALEQLAEDLNVQVSDLEFNQTMSALAQANNLTPEQLSSQLGPNGLNSYYISLMREKGLQQAMSQLGGAQEQGEQQPEPQGDTGTGAQTGSEGAAEEQSTAHPEEQPAGE